MIYIGDDTTDEDAFKSLRKQITVKVGGRSSQTRARYYLRSVQEVQRFMSLLARK